MLEDLADGFDDTEDAEAPEDARDALAMEDAPDASTRDAADGGEDPLDPTLQGGCACRAATPPSPTCHLLWFALAAATLARRRRR